VTGSGEAGEKDATSGIQDSANEASGTAQKTADSTADTVKDSAGSVTQGTKDLGDKAQDLTGSK